MSVDNQQLESMFPNMPQEQQRMFSMMRQMMEWQGKGRQMELMMEMMSHLMAARDVMAEMQSGYDA